METQLQKYEGGGALAESKDPMDILRYAVERGAGVDVVERMMAVRRELKQEAAKEAFDAAMAASQAEMPIILKSVNGAQGKYRYAPLDHIVSQVRPLLEKHGFSYSLTSKSTEMRIKAIIKITHRAGHFEESEFEVPVDQTKTRDGAALMSAPQYFGAALTFATRRVFCQAFGILTADRDTDGQTAQIKTGLKAMRGLPELKPTQVPLAPAAPEKMDREAAKVLLWATLKPKGFTSWPEAWQWCVDEIDPTLPTLKAATAEQLLALAEKAKGKL